MYCSRLSKRRSVAAVLVLCAVSSLLPGPSAAAQPPRASTLTVLTEARRVVADAEAYLASLHEMETAARARLDKLSEREAGLVLQITQARAEMHGFTIDAYVTDRDVFASVLTGSDTSQELSARIAFATSAADQADASARRYESLKAQVTPELLELAEGIADLEAKRSSANDAVLAARANEAEAERQHAIRTQIEAETRRTVATLTGANTSAAPGADSIAAPADPNEGLQGPPAPSGGPTEAQWAQLRHCEATGNYAAVSKSGKYRGAYQFDRATWATMGPPGDPAAASPAEQDRRAKLLYASRGWRPWPECGRYLR